MFAVIKTGGKQYRVKQGDKLRVESLDADEGETVSLDQVLMAGDGADVVIGDPLLSSASVSAKVLSHGRGKKIDIIKFRRCKHYRRQMGHRQNFTAMGYLLAVHHQANQHRLTLVPAQQEPQRQELQH